VHVIIVLIVQENFVDEKKYMHVCFSKLWRRILGFREFVIAEWSIPERTYMAVANVIVVPQSCCNRMYTIDKM
jgi:hypothetical protein